MSSTIEIRTYLRKNSATFRKTAETFGGLSNMAPGYPLKVNGSLILTTEALYQACRFPHRPEVQRLIIGQRSPMTAKMISKPYRKDTRPDWDFVRIKVMRWCLHLKLAQHWGKFSQLLLSTGTQPIVEDSRKDDFWGAKAIDSKTLVGMNVLGRLLMGIREDIKRGVELLLVEPLAIPNFLLFGEPLQVVDFRSDKIASIVSPVLSSKDTLEQKQLSLLSFSESVTSTLRTGKQGIDTHIQAKRKPAMIEGLRPYPEYKETGQKWLGAIPSHWLTLPNRAIFDEIKERNCPREEMLSVTITRGIIRQKTLLAGTSKKDSSNVNKAAYKLVQPNDIAYNKMRAWQGALGASNLRGIISPAYVVLRPRQEVNPWFYHHLYRTPSFAKEAERWSYGITSDMWSLRPEHFKVIYSVLPPLDEQAAIVRFLGHVDRKISGFIRAKRKLIGLLNEQKQAIIHRAVTRGLNPNVPLKPSGIPWLGEIPAHWEVMQLRQVLSFGPKNGVSPQASNDKGILSFSISAVRDGRINIAGNEKFVELNSARVAGFCINKGDILLVRGNGNITLVGKCGLVENCPKNCVYPDILMKLRPNGKMLAEFMVLAINSLYVTNQVSTLVKTSNGAFKVSGATVRSISMLVPPSSEQALIVETVKSENSTVNAAISRTEREIGLIQEYRTRLTADIVTGKLDVREAAAKSPDLPPDIAPEPIEEEILDDLESEESYE